VIGRLGQASWAAAGKASRTARTIAAMRRTISSAAVYSRTIRGKYIETTQFGTSTMELMRRSAQTLHSM
jgi:hypothetical protein